MIHARHSSLDGLDPIRGNAFCCACWVKLTLKTGAVCTYKTSAGFNQTTRSHIQVQQHRQYVPTKRRQVSNRLQEVTSKFSNTGSMYLQNVGRFQPDYKKSHPSSATEAVCTYKKSAGFNQTTRSHIQVQQYDAGTTHLIPWDICGSHGGEHWDYVLLGRDETLVCV